MKVNVYDSIRFHAMRKRRQPAAKPARLLLGMAALALAIAASAGVSLGHGASKPAPVSEHYGADVRE